MITYIENRAIVINNDAPSFFLFTAISGIISLRSVYQVV